MWEEEHSAPHDQRLSRLCRTGGPSPMDGTLATLTLTITDDKARLMLSVLRIDWMADRVPTMRRGASPKGIT